MATNEGIRYAAEPMDQKISELQPLQDMMDYAQSYAREKPEMVALICFGVGFVLGWKLKPW